MAVSARFKRLHARDCCSHGRGDDHEVVGGTTTATEEQDDEEPHEHASTREADGVRNGDLLGGIDFGLVQGTSSGVSVDDRVPLERGIEGGAGVGGDGIARLGGLDGGSGGVIIVDEGPFSGISPGGPAAGASGCAGGGGDVAGGQRSGVCSSSPRWCPRWS